MLNFEKWHGNGNDFVIINSIEEKVKIKKSLLKKISDRNKGIGFDQFINTPVSISNIGIFIYFHWAVTTISNSIITTITNNLHSFMAPAREERGETSSSSQRGERRNRFVV